MKAVRIATTNLRRFVRDRSNLFFVFVLPLGIILLIGAQFAADYSPVIGTTTQGTRLGDDIVEAIRTEGGARVETYESVDEMIGDVERGRLTAAMTIPAAADAALDAGDPVQIGFVTRPDGVGPQLQAVVVDAVASTTPERGAVRFAVERGADPAAATAVVASTPVTRIDVIAETAGEALFEGLTGQFEVGASTQLVLFMFLTGLTGSGALIQSRTLGVTTRMMGSPTAVRTIVTGEWLGRFGVVIVQGVYIVAATILLFRVDWGSFLAVFATVVVFAAVGAGAAILFGTLFKNDQQAGGFAILAGLGLAAIGGSMMPVELFSPTMRSISQFTPHAWANDAFAEILRRDGTIVDVLPQLGVLTAFALGLLVIATWRLRRVITRG